MTYYSNYNSSEFPNMLNKHEFSTYTSDNRRRYLYQEPTQILLRNYISKHTMYENVLLYHQVGTGKCHKIDTPILMFDGSVKKVQDIVKGEYLMGDDSTPRQVLSLARGTDMMYDIIENEESRYTVNEEHILCLKAPDFPIMYHSPNTKNLINIEWVEHNKFKTKSFKYEESTEAEAFLKSIRHIEQIVEISVKDYLKLSASMKLCLKGYRSGVEFQSKPVPFDPYRIGLWLGEQNESKQEKDDSLKKVLQQLNILRCKHVPSVYKCNDRTTRLKLLGGILDACGRFTKGRFHIHLSAQYQNLVVDIVYLARSLGFACNKQKHQSKHESILPQLENWKQKWKISIYGNDLEEIPTLHFAFKTVRSNKKPKDVLVSDITIKQVGRDDYFGFMLDGNCRYLLGDFTVTHNTCTAITLAEGFKEYINKMGKKIVVLVKNINIRRNFVNELVSKCTGEDYITKEERRKFNSKKNKPDVSQQKKEINKWYEFITYGSFVNKALGIRKNRQRDTSGISIRDLSNTVIIIDEAHNVTQNEMYTALYQVLKNSINYRLVLLTATPVYDTPEEIFELSNLLNIKEPDLQLPIRRNLYNGDNPMCEKINSEFITTDALRSGVTRITQHGLNKLEKSLYGKVSYLQENIETNPIKIHEGNPVIPNRIGSVKVVECEMSDYQYKIYLNALKADLGYLIDNKNPQPENIDVQRSSLYKNSSDASTMVYPDDKFGKSGFEEVFTEVSSNRYILLEKKILTTELQTYSCKLKKLLENIQNSKGNIFIYSNFVSHGGTLLVKHLLLENGYTEYNGRNEGNNFLVFDDKPNMDSYKKDFNSKANANGSLIRILIGSPLISEGITLKNVRQVHILEPYWNLSKINQIIGRTVRNNSHIALDPSERNVQIFKYVAVFKPKNKDVKTYSIDKERYILSEEKDRSNKQVERLLKKISFDCSLSLHRNTQNNNLKENYSAECDYTDCDFDCQIQIVDRNPDNSTYHLYSKFFDKFDSKFVEEKLKTMFKKWFIWKLEDIISTIKSEEPLISDSTIFTNLELSVRNKRQFTDMYGRDGFIINKGEFYIFNPDDIDIDSSLYSKAFDFSQTVNLYTLKDYMTSKNQYTTANVTSNERVGTEDRLSDVDIAFNENLLARNHLVIGTLRQRGTNDNLGVKDNIFRIINKLPLRNDGAVNENVEDRRKNLSGTNINSLTIPTLIEIATHLGLTPSGTLSFDRYTKSDLVRIIRDHLTANNMVLR